jgi:predicted ester cyclase
MSPDENKDLARRFHSCDLDGYRELMSDDFVGHDILGHTWDREFQVKGLEEDLASFEGLHDSIHDIVADEDRIAVRFTRSGVFSTRYQIYEPTNREVSFPVMEFLHISHGKIAEVWDYNDDGHVMRILRGEQP